jgi:hypothetical protein
VFVFLCCSSGCPLYFGNRFLFEESSHERRIEIGPYLNYFVVLEPANPTVTVIKLEAILRGGKRVQFNHGPVVTHQRMLHVQLRALWQDLVKFFKSMGKKIRFAVVVAGKRMSSLNDPIDIVRDMGKTAPQGQEREPVRGQIFWRFHFADANRSSNRSVELSH